MLFLNIEQPYWTLGAWSWSIFNFPYPGLQGISVLSQKRRKSSYRMEITNYYKGIDKVNIHAIEHDILLTQDIMFDYIKFGKISPVLNLNYWTPSISLNPAVKS